jgi:hypothetical protein
MSKKLNTTSTWVSPSVVIAGAVASVVKAEKAAELAVT